MRLDCAIPDNTGLCTVEPHTGSLIEDIVAQKAVTRELEAPGVDDLGEAPFYVADLYDVELKLCRWKRQLPRIKPFYAVKCNDDVEVLKLLAQLGTGFDCASKGEIQKVMNLGVHPSRIIFANPCKQTSFIRHAAKHGVYYMTYDNIAELHKTKREFPSAKLVLRILPPATDKVQVELGNKFGCLPRNARKLLKEAKALDLDVVGVSFHVGSGCYDAPAFAKAVEVSAEVFDVAAEEGFNMNLLDIGGGFPGMEGGPISFEEICDVLRPALDHYFPESRKVDIIAEPGRFFVASAFTLATNIIALRDMSVEDPPYATEIKLTVSKSPKETTVARPVSKMYYINDGVYGSFNCMLYDHQVVVPKPLQKKEDDARFPCSIWGPTCDGLDLISERALLPDLAIGDWIVFRNMGAYTLAAGSSFNGMPRPEVSYIWTGPHAEKDKQCASKCAGSCHADPDLPACVYELAERMKV